MEYETLVKFIRPNIIDLEYTDFVRDVYFFDGVKELIEKIKIKYRFGIVSDKDKSLVWNVARLNGILSLRDYVGGKELLQESIEEQLSKAAKILDVKSNEICCVCAKAETVEEAKKAQTLSIAVTYARENTKEELEKFKPDRIVENIEELSKLLGI